MDKFEIRRLNLLSVIRTHCGGKSAALADKIGRSASYVSRMLYPEGKDGRKRIGEDMKDLIESALVLPKGSLDDEAAAIAEQSGALKGAASPATSAATSAPSTEPALEPVFEDGPVSLDELRRLMPGARKIREAGADDPLVTHIPKVKLRLSAGVSGVQVEPERFDGATTTMPTEWIKRRGFDPAFLISTVIDGESMKPGLNPEDVVVVYLLDRRPVDGKVYAFNYEGEPVIKRLTRDAGRWWLTSDNPDQQRYPRKVCEGDSCIIVGRVVHKESENI